MLFSVVVAYDGVNPDCHRCFCYLKPSLQLDPNKIRTLYSSPKDNSSDEQDSK